MGGRLRELLSDPPLLDRLLWRGLLTPGARDGADRAVLATAFGALYGLGGLLGLIVLLAHDSTITNRALMLWASLAGLLVAAICLIGFRRLPRLFFQLAATAGTAIVTLAAIASADDSIPTFAPFYTFVVMLSMLFLRLVPALVQTALALGAYATLLYARDTPFATHLLLASVAMVTAVGILIGVLRTRTTRIEGELEIDAYSDALTELPNRRSFDERLRLDLDRARRLDGRLGLVICDVDHFKEANDGYGHAVGDEVLQRVGHAIERTTRAGDLAARIGGDEFGLILPDAGIDEAAAASERIRSSVEREFGSSGPPITVSCGGASAVARGTDHERLFGAADGALYAAKGAGRNTAGVAEDGGVRLISGAAATERRARRGSATALGGSR